MENKFSRKCLEEGTLLCNSVVQDYVRMLKKIFLLLRRLLAFIARSQPTHCHFNVESENIPTERNRLPYFKVQRTLAPAHFYYVEGIGGPTCVLSRCKEFKLTFE